MKSNRKRIRMPVGNIPRGLARLVRGDAGGLREFGNSTASFSASLAPLLAFPLVGAVLFGLTGHWMLASLMLLSHVSAALFQPVATEFIAGRAGTDSNWLMTSTALNWSVWLILPLLVLGLLIANGFATIGLSPIDSVMLTTALIGAYLVWIQWFILRAGLQLRWYVALAVVLAMNIVIAAISYFPYLTHPELIILTLHPPAT